MKKVYAAVMTVEEGLFVLRVPDVPGCITITDTIGKAHDLIRDALSGSLCVLEDEGCPIPEPTNPLEVRADVGTVVLVDVDTVEYRKATDTRAVRKNVSMPAWMSYLADKAGINCSQVLQDALRKQLKISY